ncbi:PIG-L family deacetylase [Svornostia abyssi]|uniref:PIG-L family deacetylase n=1 Tax=Svornostia abyssi TaxID=2898438 RepID=A0ABY5PFR2_9ACTN|nr:PIG-L family deacetylase [Parviterribacteraceae bacterium J379]
MASPPPHAPTVLHVAPHPDDECLGAGPTLLALRAHGWRVVNLACSYGSAEAAPRRRDELTRACSVLGFELRDLEPTAPLRSSEAQATIARGVGAALDELAPALVVGPDPHDAHPAHEAVGRGVRDALHTREVRPRWWCWNLWGAAARPTLFAPCAPMHLDTVAQALREHAGEVARTDYVAALYARARLQATLGGELVFGWGATPPGGVEGADLLTEVLTDRTPGWQAAAPRRLDPADPLASAAPGHDLGGLLWEPSPRARAERAEPDA